VTRSKLNHIVLAMYNIKDSSLLKFLTPTSVHRYTWINVICLVGFRDHFFDGLVPSVYVRFFNIINGIKQ